MAASARAVAAPTRRLTVRIDADAASKLGKIAAAERVSVAEVARTAIGQYVEGWAVWDRLSRGVAEDLQDARALNAFVVAALDRRSGDM